MDEGQPEVLPRIVDALETLTAAVREVEDVPFVNQAIALADLTRNVNALTRNVDTLTRMVARRDMNLRKTIGRQNAHLNRTLRRNMVAMVNRHDALTKTVNALTETVNANHGDLVGRLTVIENHYALAPMRSYNFKAATNTVLRGLDGDLPDNVPNTSDLLTKATVADLDRLNVFLGGVPGYAGMRADKLKAVKVFLGLIV